MHLVIALPAELRFGRDNVAPRPFRGGASPPPHFVWGYVRVCKMHTSLFSSQRSGGASPPPNYVWGYVRVCKMHTLFFHHSEVEEHRLLLILYGATYGYASCIPFFSPQQWRLFIHLSVARFETTIFVSYDSWKCSNCFGRMTATSSKACLIMLRDNNNNCKMMEKVVAK